MRSVIQVGGPALGTRDVSGLRGCLAVDERRTGVHRFTERVGRAAGSQRPERETLMTKQMPLSMEVAQREHGGTFGHGGFGVIAEAIARFLGTPQYLISQSVLVVAWIGFNGYALGVHFDPYPFILLNLAFSLQAAYAAPLILLAQTRQAARDKAYSEAYVMHGEELNQTLVTLLRDNTRMTEETRRLTLAVHQLTVEVHERLGPNPWTERSEDRMS